MTTFKNGNLHQDYQSMVKEQQLEIILTEYPNDEEANYAIDIEELDRSYLYEVFDDAVMDFQKLDFASENWTCNNTLKIFQEEPSEPEIMSIFQPDWAMLKKQKLSLLKVIDLVNPDLASDLTGILNFIDHIQEVAVDEAGVPEIDVFHTEEEPHPVDVLRDQILEYTGVSVERSEAKSILKRVTL